MAKEDLIKQDGVVSDALSNANFKVQLENGHVILAQSLEKCGCTISEFFRATRSPLKCLRTIWHVAESSTATNKFEKLKNTR